MGGPAGSPDGVRLREIEQKPLGALGVRAGDGYRCGRDDGQVWIPGRSVD